MLRYTAAVYLCIITFTRSTVHSNFGSCYRTVDSVLNRVDRSNRYRHVMIFRLSMAVCHLVFLKGRILTDSSMEGVNMSHRSKFNGGQSNRC